MTNEQAVLEAEQKIDALKNQYTSFLMPIVIRIQKSGEEPNVEELLHCQQLGARYFNYIENFVGNSGLLGAHANGKWVTGFAETCHSVLNAYITHINFLNSYSTVIEGNICPPDQNAYGNMQRMTKEYLPQDSWQQLQGAFIANSLPITGFKYKGAKDLSRIPRWQLITSVSIGCVALISSVIIALMLPNPTTYQVFILRGLFAIALASIASIIPGFLNLETGAKSAAAYFGIYAGGAIAIFVLIWLFNPPEIKDNTSLAESVINKSGS